MNHKSFQLNEKYGFFRFGINRQILGVFGWNDSREKNGERILKKKDFKIFKLQIIKLKKIVDFI